MKFGSFVFLNGSMAKENKVALLIKKPWDPINNNVPNFFFFADFFPDPFFSFICASFAEV